MRNILAILKHNLKSVMKNWFWLVFILPLAVNVVLYAFNQKIEKQSDNRVSISVYSEDRGEIYEKILPKEKFREINIVSSKEEIKSMVKEGEISLGVIINSSDLYKDLKNNKKNTIEIVSKDDNVNKEYVANIINNGIMQVTSFGNTEEEVLKGFEKYEKASYEFNYKSSTKEEDLAYIMAFGIFCMAFLFIAGQGISPLLKEKEAGIDRRILTSKVKKYEYILGHVMGCFLLLMAQSLTLVSAFYAFNKNFNVNFVWMLILCFVLSFVGVAISLFILSISNNSTMYYTLLSLITMPISLLSGGFVPMDFMPEVLQKISLISPLTWINNAYAGILMNGDISEICMNLLAAVAISLVFTMLFLIIESKRKSTINSL